MGDCNSCEEIDETRFWRWEQEPCPDEPTAIAPVSTASLQTPAPVLTPKDFAAPIVAIQNAPAAPAPTDLSAALQVLGNADAFRDITGLAQNQLNALSALQSSLKTAEAFGKDAAGFVKAEEARRGLPRSLDAIKSAKRRGLINDDDEKELTAQAFQTALGLPAGTGEKPVQKQSVKDLLSAAAKSPKMKTSVTDQVGDRKQTVTIEKDDSGPARDRFPGGGPPAALEAGQREGVLGHRRDDSGLVEAGHERDGRERADRGRARHSSIGSPPNKGFQAPTSRRSWNGLA